MATQVQFRGGTTTEHASFNGAAREVTVDTTKQTVVVQDGSTNGGFPLLREKNPDNQKVYFGTDNDLELYFDGTNSHLNNSTGYLVVGTDSYALKSQNLNEFYIKALKDGGVELYYDNAKTFETTADGPAISSQGADVSRLRFLTGSHTTTKIGYYGLSNKFGMDINGGFEIRDAGNSYETMFRAVPNGAVELFYDGVKKLESASAGVTVTGNIDFTGNLGAGDNKYIKLGNQADFQIYHDAGNNWIDSVNNHALILRAGTGIAYLQGGEIKIGNEGNSEKYITAIENGAVKLYYDNSLKLNTHADGVEILGKVYMADSKNIELGNSQDLKIFHNGTDSYLLNSTGRLLIPSAEINFMSADQNEWIIKSFQNAGVELYFDNSKKVETTGQGVNFKGLAADSAVYKFTDLGYKFVDFATIGSGTAYYTAFRHYDNASTYQNFLLARQDGATELFHSGSKKLETTTAGITVAGAVTETSDIALKTNIEPIDNVLDKIKQITGYTYQFKDTGHDSMGVTAQDVEKVFPELVHGKEGAKTLQYSGLIGALIESVKELSAKVAALESS